MEATDNKHNRRLSMEAEAFVEEPTELSLLSKSPISPVSEKTSMPLEYGGVSQKNTPPAVQQEGKKLFQFLATLIGEDKFS